MAVIALLWAAIGLGLAYPKAQYGAEIEWIGVLLQLGTESVTAGISQERKEKLLEEILALRDKGMCHTADARKLAGQLSWITGFIPRIRSLVGIYITGLRAT